LGGDLKEFGNVADNFTRALNERHEVERAFTSFNANFPQYELIVDHKKAKNMGVSVRGMMRSIQSYFGRVQSGDFNRFGRQYRVYMQADMPYRQDAQSLAAVFVKNDKGEMVPVNTLGTLREVRGPEIVRRHNLFNAISINITPSEGYSSGTVMEVVEDIAREVLPVNYDFEWTGMSLEEKEAGNETTMIFVLSIIVVYFLLAAQYESYFLPMAILLSVPC